MRVKLIPLFLIALCGLARAAEAAVLFAGERRLNNLVAELLEVASVAKSSQPFTFTRSSDGWIHIAAISQGAGTVRVLLDKVPEAVIVQDGDGRGEAMRHVTRGTHTIQVECQGEIRVEKLAVKAIPELIHCGLGFDPEIKSFGVYDMDFLKADILPNVTTLIVPNHIKLSEPMIDIRTRRLTPMWVAVERN
jgi:hypothetical protein